jgi:hypothetical protein
MVDARRKEPLQRRWLDEAPGDEPRAPAQRYWAQFGIKIPPNGEFGLEDARDYRLRMIQLVEDQLTKLEETVTAPKTAEATDVQVKRVLEERRVEREVQRRLALVDGFGEDVYPEGTVITYKKKYVTTKDKDYTYAVIKNPNGKWYSTGHDHVYGVTFTWDELVEHWVTGPTPVEVVYIKPEGATALPSDNEPASTEPVVTKERDS